MASRYTGADFIVWGTDQTAHGPLELPTLIAWVEDERVTADTWVFALKRGAWQKAAQLPELHRLFESPASQTAARASRATSPRGFDPGALRRMKFLSNMTDEQLERFASFIEVEKFPQRTLIVRQGAPGDTMYFILEGELRVRLKVAGRETTLATLGPGDFCGDISLFDKGPRSADVVANRDSVLVKISSRAFDELAKEAPELATPLLRAIGRTLTARIRADNQRYSDSVRTARAGKRA